MQFSTGAGSENAFGHPGAFASRAASFACASDSEPPSTDVSPPPLDDELPPPLLEEEAAFPASESLTDAELPPQAPITHTASIEAPTLIPWS